MKKLTRRKMLGMTAALIPLTMISTRAMAGSHAKDENMADGKSHAGHPDTHLDPKNPQAAALQYTHKSTVEGKQCWNCNLYQGGDADWGGCPIFAGKQVAGAGWCSAWVAKQ
ncbi:MAG TPA: high-potential iron-sulfur protein [Marinobacterium sp.]|nr:high-potential iron-sulfur protein [Marinobacterium sp.]